MLRLGESGPMLYGSENDDSCLERPAGLPNYLRTPGRYHIRLRGEIPEALP